MAFQFWISKGPGCGLAAQQRSAENKGFVAIDRGDSPEARQDSDLAPLQLMKIVTTRAATTSETSSGNARCALRLLTERYVVKRPNSLTVRNSRISTIQITAITTPDRDGLAMH